VGTGATNGETISALWLGSPDDGRLLVAGGERVRGTTHADLGGPREFGVAEALGLVVFEADLTDDDGSAGEGLWAVDVKPSSRRPARPLLRSGQRLEIAPGDVREVAGASLLGVTRGGTVTAVLEFTDLGQQTGARSQGIFRFSLRSARADHNADGVVDRGDTVSFVQAFIDADDSADLNGDGLTDQGDIAVFVQVYLEAVGA